jgi:hypothetical protein
LTRHGEVSVLCAGILYIHGALLLLLWSGWMWKLWAWPANDFLLHWQPYFVPWIWITRDALNFL